MTGILQNQESGVLTLTLNRVDKKNSLNASMYAALADALQMATENAEVKVVLVQGHETVFSAGNDIADFLQQPPATEASAGVSFPQRHRRLSQTLVGLGVWTCGGCGHHHAVPLRLGVCG